MSLLSLLKGTYSQIISRGFKAPTQAGTKPRQGARQRGPGCLWQDADLAGRDDIAGLLGPWGIFLYLPFFGVERKQKGISDKIGGTPVIPQRELGSLTWEPPRRVSPQLSEPPPPPTPINI